MDTSAVDEKVKQVVKTIDSQVQTASTGIGTCGNGVNMERSIGLLDEGIRCGEHWYMALLRAMSLWDAAYEVYNGHSLCYLIAGEAFDWLLLAERLCAEIDGQIPEDEKINLLFAGRPPIRLTEREFKRLIGTDKYRHYLNYFYGVTVEEALFLVIQGEVRKEQRASGYCKEGDVINEVYRRLYGTSGGLLLKQFRHDKKYPHCRYIGLGEIKEFTYWRFRHRLKNCDGVRIASDTRKALSKLSQDGFPGRLLYDCEDAIPA